MRHSSYILGGMELLTQHAESQKSNIYWTFVYIRRGRGMYLLDSDLRALNEGDIIFYFDNTVLCGIKISQNGTNITIENITAFNKYLNPSLVSMPDSYKIVEHWVPEE